MSSSASMVVDSLRCEYLVDPIGIGEPAPRLSWKLRAALAQAQTRRLAQSAYQLRVARSPALLGKGTGDLWDSGKVASAETTFIPYAGKPLASGQRAYWNVVTWDQDNRPSAPSATGRWEMGLLDPAEWKGEWIGSSICGGTHHEAPAPMVRKPFTLPAGKTIASAAFTQQRSGSMSSTSTGSVLATMSSHPAGPTTASERSTRPTM